MFSLTSEPSAVASLFGVNSIRLSRVGVGNGVIGNHYKMALTSEFGAKPRAAYAIILEEDLIVSPDILRLNSCFMK